MKVYIVDITTRKNDRDRTLGPFTNFEKALESMRKELDFWDDQMLFSYTEYDSDFFKGKIFTEEDSYEIIERDLL